MPPAKGGQAQACKAPSVQFVVAGGRDVYVYTDGEDRSKDVPSETSLR